MKVLTFGEVMLRLKTPEHLKILQADTFEANYAEPADLIDGCLSHLVLRHFCHVRNIPCAAGRRTRRYLLF